MVQCRPISYVNIGHENENDPFVKLQFLVDNENIQIEILAQCPHINVEYPHTI